MTLSHRKLSVDLPSTKWGLYRCMASVATKSPSYQTRCKLKQEQLLVENEAPFLRPLRLDLPETRPSIYHGTIWQAAATQQLVPGESGGRTSRCVTLGLRVAVKPAERRGRGTLRAYLPWCPDSMSRFPPRAVPTSGTSRSAHTTAA
jgi:hypothetical protein